MAEEAVWRGQRLSFRGRKGRSGGKACSAKWLKGTGELMALQLTVSSPTTQTWDLQVSQPQGLAHALERTSEGQGDEVLSRP